MVGNTSAHRASQGHIPAATRLAVPSTDVKNCGRRRVHITLELAWSAEQACKACQLPQFDDAQITCFPPVLSRAFLH